MLHLKSETAKNYYIYTACGGTIKVHDWKFHEFKHLYKEIHDKTIFSLAMYPPYCLNFYTCAYDNVLREWNSKTMELEYDWGCIDENDQVRCMQISPNGHFIFTTHRDHTVKQWTNEFKKCMHTFKDIHTGSVDTMAFTPCGTYLYTAGRDMVLNKISIRHQKVINSWRNLHPDMIMQMTVTPSGKF